jgi:hypothetical protein
MKLISFLLLLSTGHLIRYIRWTLLLGKNGYANPKRMLAGFTIGNFLNLFLPLRIGEIFKIVITSMNKSWIPVVIATTLIERFLDIMFLIFWLTVFGAKIITPSIFLQFLAIGLIIIIIDSILRIIRKKKTHLMHSSEFLNYLILTRLAVFKLLKSTTERKILFLSFILWIPYLLAALQISSIYEINSNKALKVFTLTFEPLAWTLNQREIMMATLALLPAYFVYLKSKKEESYVDNLSLISSQIIVENESSYQKMNSSFLALGSGEKIRKIFNGGSGALTLLVKDLNGKSIVRKIAWGQFEADTLRKQFHYLTELSSTYFPKVEIRLDSQIAFCYEMEYFENYTSLENNIHSNAHFDWVSFLSSYESAFPEKKLCGNNDFQEFVNSKLYKARQDVTKKLSEVDNPELLGRLDFISDYFVKKSGIIEHSREVHDTHGDLSTTNVLVDSFSSFKFIDVTRTNKFSSRFMDLGKLYFSLNSGYESYAQNLNTFVNGSRIELFKIQTLRSKLAAEELKKILVARYGTKAFLEVQFSSVVHASRVLPYRLKQDSSNAVGWILFYLDYLEEVKSEIDVN